MSNAPHSEGSVLRCGRGRGRREGGKVTQRDEACHKHHMIMNHHFSTIILGGEEVESL